MKTRDYNIYQCLTCKHFERHERKEKKQAGFCSAQKTAIQIVHSNLEPLLHSMPCTEFIREKRK